MKCDSTEVSTAKGKTTYTVEEIAAQLGVSKKVAYALVQTDQFRSVSVGRAIRVSKSSFDAWLNAKESTKERT